MPTRFRVRAWIVACAALQPLSASAQELPEPVLIEHVLRDGPQARAIRADVEVTRREQEARLTWQNPAVQYSREGAGFTEFLQVEQALPAFGLRGALTRLGVTATAAAEAERDARLWELRADARRAVAHLHAAQGRREMADAVARDTVRLVDILRTREREGEGSRFDRVRAEQELREAEMAATAAAIAKADALAMLSTLLPSDVHVMTIAAGGIRAVPVQPVEELEARARTSRADLRALQLAAERTDLEAGATRKARGPAPTLFGGLKRSDTENGRESGGLFGVNLTVPLFDRGARDTARWAAERTRLEAEREALIHATTREIHRAADSLGRRQAALAADDPGASAALAEMAEVAYREGEVGILELLDAVRTTARARLRTIELELDARLAAIALERAVGDVLWP